MGLIFFIMGFLNILEKPSSSPPKKHTHPQKPRPRARLAPIQMMSMLAMDAKVPIIVPGKMMVFDNARGIIVIGITI